MGEAFKQVKKGDPIPLDNKLWNAIISAARTGRNQQPLPSSNSPTLVVRPPDVLIKNTSNSLVLRGHVIPQPNRGVYIEPYPSWTGSGVDLHSASVLRTAIPIDPWTGFDQNDKRACRSVFVTSERILPGKIGGAYTHGIVLAQLGNAPDPPWELDEGRQTGFYQRTMRFAKVGTGAAFRVSWHGFNVVYVYPEAGFVRWGLVDISQYISTPKKAIVRATIFGNRTIRVLPDLMGYEEAKALTETEMAEFPALTTGFGGELRNNFFEGDNEGWEPSWRFENGQLLWIFQISDGTWAPIATDVFPHQAECASFPFLPRLDIPEAVEGPIEKIGYQDGCLVRFLSTTDPPDPPDPPDPDCPDPSNPLCPVEPEYPWLPYEGGFTASFDSDLNAVGKIAVIDINMKFGGTVGSLELETIKVGEMAVVDLDAEFGYMTGTLGLASEVIGAVDMEGNFVSPLSADAIMVGTKIIKGHSVAAINLGAIFSGGILKEGEFEAEISLSAVFVGEFSVPVEPPPEDP